MIDVRRPLLNISIVFPAFPSYKIWRQASSTFPIENVNLFSRLTLNGNSNYLKQNIMRTILSTIALVCIAFSIQANDMKIQPCNLGSTLSTINIEDPINLLTIKADVGANKRDYFMTGSVTILKAPKAGDVASSFDASFRNSKIIVYKGRDYVQANPQAKRNDNNRTGEVRIYVAHDNRGKGNVDKNKVKINWKGDATGEISGNLSNVTVLYQQNSILITGTLQKNGYTIGVSLALTKEAKLI